MSLLFPSPALPRLRMLCHIALALLWLGLTAGAAPAAAADTVAVVLSERGGVYAEFLEALNAGMAQSPGRRVVRLTGVAAAGEKIDEAELGDASLVLAVGAGAARALARMEGTPPVLSVLVPRLTFERIAAESGRRARPGSFSALYLDQPLSRQLNLLRFALPGRKRVAALLGPESAALAPRLRSAVSRAGFELQMEQVAEEGDIVPALNRLLPGTDVLLALPDGLVFNRNTARPVLLTTYRHQRPVVGFSQAYVTAGALAAVFSTPAQMGRQTAEFLRGLPAGRVTLGAPLYPSYFSVAVNRNVARSLGLDLPDEGVLREALEKAGEGE